MMSYLSPGYLRIGGTEADRLVFKDDTRPISSHPSTCLDPNSTFVMTGKSFSFIQCPKPSYLEHRLPNLM